MHSHRDKLKLTAGALALALSGCGGGGASSSSGTVVTAPTPPPAPPPPPATTTKLKDVFADDFDVGAAIGLAEIDPDLPNEAVLSAHFSSLTAENVMKPATLAPSEGVYDFSAADALVDYAARKNMRVRGHALLWHRQTPDYFFNGPPSQIRTRLEDYVFTVVDRYKGQIDSWDVVNEVSSDDPGATAPYRDSNWYRAVGGPDFIDWAFNAARAADPNATLYINDYNTEFSGKRGRLLAIARDLLDRGLPLDGIGHQLHMNTGNSASQVTEAFDDVAALSPSLRNQVTELDISVYEDPGSCFSDQVGCVGDYGATVPPTILRKQAELYRDLFNLFQTVPSLDSVTLWGVSDAQSWLNYWPVDRTNYPLLFDRQRDPKAVFQAVVDPDYIIQ